MAELVFFTDRDLGKSFPSALAAAGARVERHGDHFVDYEPDERWIAEVACRGWIAITHDKSIARRPNEKAAVLDAGLGLLVLVGAAPHVELASNFIALLPRITSFVERSKRPFIARVYRPTPAEISRKRRPVGRVEHWLP